MPADLVHLVRHGEVLNPDRILYGRLPGYGLSELGHRMAATLGANPLPIFATITLPLARRSVIAGALLGYWLLLAWAPVPGLGQPSLAREVNLEGWLDQLVFGSHIWKAGTLWDPEGVRLASRLPAWP